MKITLILGDIIIVLLSILLAYLIRLGNLRSLDNSRQILVIFLITAIYIVSFYIFNFYEIKHKFRSIRFVVDFVFALAMAFIMISLVFFILPFKFGRGVFLISLGFISVLTLVWRIVLCRLFYVVVSPNRILIIADRNTEESVRTLIKDNPDYQIMGYIELKDQSLERETPKDQIDFQRLKPEIDTNKIDYIIVTADSLMNKELRHLLFNYRLSGVRISDLESFSEILTGKLSILQSNGHWLLASSGFSMMGNAIFNRIKRTIDVAISVITLVFTLPLQLLIALFIKLDSKGPVLFFQERVGENEKSFMLIKFRTMVKHAEENGPRWAQENDSRITGIGKILRKTRLDELPQIINVIKGDMSLVGPRPERGYFVEHLSKKIPYYSARFAVKPGITGWAQVNFRYGSTEQDAIEKLSYELYYIKNQSLLLDIRILLKTIRVVLFGMGR